MAAAGIASRRACEELIFEGKVTVNGKIVTAPQTLVSAETDKIAVDEVPLKSSQEKIYLILNKPKGYTCTSLPTPGKKIVLDLFKHLPYRLFTIGRLDRDTTGLLLVTNDGHFAQNVIHPSKGLTKEYLNKTQQEITPEQLAKIARGGLVEGSWVKPVKVTKVRRGTFKIIVREGKKREVRVLAQKAGLDIVSLQRLRIGSLTLGNLALGQWREMTEREKELLLNP